MPASRATWWTFDELTINGWYPIVLEPADPGSPWSVKLTLYWAEASKHTEIGYGTTRDEAIADVEDKVNAWLEDRRVYQPRR